MQTFSKTTGTIDQLIDRDAQVVWHPFTPLKGAVPYQAVTKAEGVYLHTADGRKIIDAVSSWWVNIHGHSNPHIAEAVGRQAREMAHVIFAGFTHEPAVKLAENVLSLLPAEQEKVFFSDDGSTSVEVGIKMAFQYWHNLGQPKTRILALEGAYHGDTFGAMSLGGKNAFNEPFAPFLFDVAELPFPGYDHADHTLQCLADELAKGDVAAMIVEPLVQGSAGMRMYTAQTLDAMMALCQQHGVLVIADEVMTGFGRTGKYFATDHTTHKPDIYCLSKGLTGGTLPMGLTTCTTQVAEPFKTDNWLKTFFHGHSYTANPIACAAANASFEILTQPACTERINHIVQCHQAAVQRFKQNPKFKEVRQTGTILAMEIVNNQPTSYFNKDRNKIYQYFIDHGMLLRPLGNVIYVLPPYVITADELNLVYDRIEAMAEDLF